MSNWLFANEPESMMAKNQELLRADSILLENLNKKHCVARSSCSIKDQLLYGSPYRQYVENFDQCIIYVGEALDRRQSEYQLAYTSWKNEPFKKQKFCQSRLDFLSAVDNIVSQQVT